MARGTFANICLMIKLLKGEIGPKTIHIPSGEKLYVFDAAMKYKNEGQIPSSWRAQRMEVEAPMIGQLMLQGVKAVIVKSFERIHRSNLVGMSIIPRCFKAGEDADVLGLTSHERFTINLSSSVSDIKPSQDVTVATDNGKYSMCTVDTEGTGNGECSCGGKMVKGLCVKPNKGDALLFWSMVCCPLPFFMFIYVHLQKGSDEDDEEDDEE